MHDDRSLILEINVPYFILILLSLFCSSLALGETQTRGITIHETFTQATLGSHIDVFQDSTGNKTLKDMTDPDNPLPWVNHPTNTLIFGFRPETFWFKTVLNNDCNTERDLILEEAYPLIDDITVYGVVQGATLFTYMTGDQQPFRDRPILHPEFIFPISIPAKTSVDLYIRVKNTESLELPLTLFSRDSYIFHNNIKGKIEGIFYGFILVMALYNLSLFFFTQDKNYLYYVMFVISTFATCATQRGDFYALIYPGSVFLAHIMIPWSLLFTYATAILFLRNFLRVPEQLPRIDKVLDLLLYLAIFLAILISFMDYRTVIILIVLYQLPLTVTAFTVSFILSRRGQKTALIYLVGWSMLLLNIFGNMLAKVGLIHNDFFYIYGLRLGVAFELVIFSIALAYRYNEEKDMRIKTEQALSLEHQEKLVAQEKAYVTERTLRETREAMLRNQQALNENLEKMVQKRTYELESTMKDLETANSRLEALSEEDALTGLKNRRFFDNRLCEEWKRGMRLSEPIALLMIDIDYFKNINDTYGHAFGDHVLREVARIIAQTSRRSTDIAVRYGGEEFTLILTNTDQSGAIFIAKRLITEVRELVLEDRVSGLAVKVTISIGINCAIPPHGSHEHEFLHQADQALYYAKNQGRDKWAMVSENGFIDNE